MKFLEKPRVVLATAIINFPLCLFFVYGNLSTYMYSYFSFRSKADVDSVEWNMSWMVPSFMICKVLGAFPLDIIRRRLGLRRLLACGILLFNSGILLTFYTLQHSMAASVLTLMISAGLGNVVISVGSLMYNADWFDENVGVASSIQFAAASLGGVLLNLVVTFFINPENQDPDAYVGKMVFFSQPDILDGVPYAFLLFGGLSMGIQIVGFCLYQKPPERRDGKGSHEEHPCHSSTSSSSSLRIPQTLSYTTEKGKDSNSSCDNSFDFARQCLADSSNPNGDAVRNCSLRKSQETNHTDKTSFQVLKSETYYILSFGFMVVSLGFIIVSNYFKLFGQLWISNDSFLAITGSICSLTSAVVQISTGYCVDRLGIKKTLITQMAVSSLLMCWWYFTARLDRWIFLLWTVALYGVLSNQLNLFSLSVLKCFGTSHYASNIAMVSSATLLVFFGAPIFIVTALESLGWFWLFFISSAATALSLLHVVKRLRV